jgi:hypothetical protein
MDEPGAALDSNHSITNAIPRFLVAKIHVPVVKTLILKVGQHS